MILPRLAIGAVSAISVQTFRARVADRIQDLADFRHGVRRRRTPVGGSLTGEIEGAFARVRIGAVLRPAVLLAFVDSERSRAAPNARRLTASSKRRTRRPARLKKAVLDAAIVANSQAVEHYEMCRYGTLIAWAEELGHQDIVRFTNLNEEKAANTKLNTIALRKGVNKKASTAA